MIGGNFRSTRTQLPSDCEKNCEWKSYQGQAARLPSSWSGALSLPLQLFELCDLQGIRYLSLPTTVLSQLGTRKTENPIS